MNLVYLTVCLFLNLCVADYFFLGLLRWKELRMRFRLYTITSIKVLLSLSCSAKKRNVLRTKEHSLPKLGRLYKTVRKAAEDVPFSVLV